MGYLKSKKILKGAKNNLKKSLAGLRYILKDYSEVEFGKYMKEISCEGLSTTNIVKWVDKHFYQMDDIEKSALILGICMYRKDAYYYKYVALQTEKEESNMMGIIAVSILSLMFILACLSLQYWSSTNQTMYLYIGLAIVGSITIPRFIPERYLKVSKTPNTAKEIFYLKSKLSSLKCDVDAVETEIYHTAYRYWNTCRVLGCRHYN